MCITGTRYKYSEQYHLGEYIINTNAGPNAEERRFQIIKFPNARLSCQRYYS